MPPKGRKNTSLNNSKGLTKPDPWVQEIMEKPPEPLQENPPPAASTEPITAPKSTISEGYEGTPAEAYQT